MHKILTWPSPIPYVTTSVSSLLRLIVFVGLNVFFGWNRNRFTGDFKRYGWLTIANGGLTLLFAARGNNLLALITRIPSSLLLQYHRWCGLATVVHATIHFVLNTRHYLRTDQLDVVFQNRRIQVGIMAWISLALTALTSFVLVRRRWYEGFYYAHVVLFPIFVAGALVHATRAPEFLLPGLVLWGLDRVFRFVQTFFLRGSLTVTQAEHFAGDIVKLHFGGCDNKAANFLTRVTPFHPGQIAWLQIPRAGFLAWHPFTIASAPGDGEGVVAIRGLGGYTRRVQRTVDNVKPSGRGPVVEMAAPANNNMVAMAASPSPMGAVASDKAPQTMAMNPMNGSCLPTPLRLRFDGPFGVGSLQWGSHAVTAIVAGGIGITPGISIASYIVRQAAAADASRRGAGRAWHVHLLWVVREAATTAVFERELAELAHIAANPAVPVTLDVDIFVTRHRRNNYNAHQNHDAEANAAYAPGEHRYAGPGTVYLGSRPDIHAWLRDAVAARRPGLDAAVSACGPRQLVRDVRKAAARVSSSGGPGRAGIYYVDEEKFEF